MTELDRSLWTGRVDAADGDAGRRWHQVVRAYDETSPPGIALIGFASDAGVARNHGRVGAAEGPAALRRALANLAWLATHDVPLLDAGDIVCTGDALEQAQEALGRRVAQVISRGHWPLVLGGGHEVAWGSFQGLAAAVPRTARIGIVNFDAHFDLRAPLEGGRGTSGSPFLQIADALAGRGSPFNYLCMGVSPASNTQALFATAAARQASWVLDEDLTWSHLREPFDLIDRFIDSVDVIQLSLCLDVFPGSIAPGVSAPAARGLPVDLGFVLLRRLLDRAGLAPRGGKVALAEIAELNPRFDRDGCTARLAARLAFEAARPLLI
jgi:formiminoglutamase